MVEISIPDSMKDEVEPIRTILVEAAAETSESLWKSTSRRGSHQGDSYGSS